MLVGRLWNVGEPTSPTQGHQVVQLVLRTAWLSSINGYWWLLGNSCSFAGWWFINGQLIADRPLWPQWFRRTKFQVCDRPLPAWSVSDNRTAHSHVDGFGNTRIFAPRTSPGMDVATQTNHIKQFWFIMEINQLNHAYLTQPNSEQTNLLWNFALINRPQGPTLPVAKWFTCASGDARSGKKSSKRNYEP